MVQQYFYPKRLKSNDNIELGQEDSFHLIKVMRAVSGAPIEIVSSDGEKYEAKVREATIPTPIDILNKVTKKFELPVKVTILCGLPKQNKADLITQKATELGAHQIGFLEMDRSISSWDQKKRKSKIERLQKIAKEAAEQSHRTRVPKLIFLDGTQEIDFSDNLVIVCDEDIAKSNHPFSLKKTLEEHPNSHSILMIFGPEGGLSDAERQLLKDKGAVFSSLGPRILRCETAPLYALSVISALTEL